MLAYPAAFDSVLLSSFGVFFCERICTRQLKRKLVNFRSNVLWGGDVCGSILDGVDKLNNLEMSIHIGA